MSDEISDALATGDVAQLGAAVKRAYDEAPWEPIDPYPNDVLSIDKRRFVRFTYQECEEGHPDQPGGFLVLGITQDIRLMAGRFDIAGDIGGSIRYDIVNGKLQEREL